MKRFLSLPTALLLYLFLEPAEASHLRAGEIVAKKLNNLEYEFTLILYRNTDGVPQPNAKFDFSDGTSQTVNLKSVGIPVSDKTERLEFVVRKTFSGAGNFTVSFKENFRNLGIENINNGFSGETPFYVETQILIDPLGGANTSPQFLYPPIDKGTINQIYTHAPAAYDQEGDSLSFSLENPKSEKGKDVPNYTQPNKVGNVNGTETFSMDNKTGLITWNKPVKDGLYNIAFRVYEWRNGYLLGYVTRDMQIQISTNTNIIPTLNIPLDTCISAGKVLEQTITANYQIGEPNNLTAFSGIFNLPSPKNIFNATKTLSQKNINIDTLFFRWQTSCELIQAQPYQVTFKAEDRMGSDDALASIKVWQIKLIPPAFKNLKVKPNGRNINLSWDAYPCTNTESIVILRKECGNDTTAILDSCTTGNNYPEGFSFLTRLGKNASSFVDNNAGLGLEFEKKYCYYVYAEFPAPQKGYSRASALACSSLDNDVPLILKTSVQETNATKGKVEIAWNKPKHLKATTPPPYQLRVFRKENNIVIGILNRPNITDTLALADTVLVDSAANTITNNLSYYIEFYSGNNLIYTSETASTVLLEGIGRNKKNQLRWTSNTPWTNDTTIIFRKSVGDLDFVDTVFSVNGYVDEGLETGKTYTYYVKTLGRFGCNQLLGENKVPYPIVNLSQTISLIPTDEINDTLRPCPPFLSITKNGSCEEAVNFSNKLSWVPDINFSCDTNIVGYKLYLQNSTNDYTLYLNDIIKKTDYDGSVGKAVSGCFAVTAVNGRGLESNKSNVVCSDSCYYFELPNVFTPNGDNYNDTFTPKPFPKNVEKVKFTVYNRWGSEIYQTENDININWNGDNATDGLYYYKAEISIGNFNGPPIKVTRKGWVLIAR